MAVAMIYGRSGAGKTVTHSSKQKQRAKIAQFGRVFTVLRNFDRPPNLDTS